MSAKPSHFVADCIAEQSAQLTPAKRIALYPVLLIEALATAALLTAVAWFVGGRDYRVASIRLALVVFAVLAAQVGCEMAARELP